MPLYVLGSISCYLEIFLDILKRRRILITYGFRMTKVKALLVHSTLTTLLETIGIRLERAGAGNPVPGREKNSNHDSKPCFFKGEE